MDTHAAEPAVIETGYGPMLVPRDGVHAGRVVRAFGATAAWEAAFLAPALPDNARVADCRAFVGAFGLGLGAVRPLGSLCLLEPDAGLSSLLRRNASRRPGTIVRTGADAAPRPVLADEGPFDLIRLDADQLPDLDPALFDGAPPHTRAWIVCADAAAARAAGAILLAAGLTIHLALLPASGVSAEDIDPFSDWAMAAAFWVGPIPPPPLATAALEAGATLRAIGSATALDEALRGGFIPPKPSAVAQAALIMLDAERRYLADTAIRFDAERAAALARAEALKLEIAGRTEALAEASAANELLAAKVARQAVNLAELADHLAAAEARLRDQAPELARLAQWDASSTARVVRRLGAVAAAHPRAWRAARRLAAVIRRVSRRRPS